MKILRKIKSLIKTYVPVIPGIIYIIAIMSGVLYVSFLVSESFSDFFNQNISQALRLVMAKITGILPFSIEILVNSGRQHHSARSYTSISRGRPFCRQ